MSTSLETLQEATSKLQRSLQMESSSISNTLNDPACSSGNATHTCSNIRTALNQLAVSTNFNGVKPHNHGHHSEDISFNISHASGISVAASRCQSSVGKSRNCHGDGPRLHRTEGIVCMKCLLFVVCCLLSLGPLCTGVTIFRL